jgi:hypothetical protein
MNNDDQTPASSDLPQPDTASPLRVDAPQPQSSGDSNDAALTLIREKLARIYAGEPNAQIEEQAATTAPQRSKHQQFMYELHNSGKNLADIQTAWHAYYASLSDTEKYEVWQEFYAAKGRLPTVQQTSSATKLMVDPKPIPPRHITPLSQSYTQSKQQPEVPGVVIVKPSVPADTRALKDIQQKVVDTVSAQGKLHIGHHLHLAWRSAS